MSRAFGIVVVLLGLLAPVGAAAENGQALYVEADRLFDGRTMLRGRVSVAVRNGRVIAAGRLRIPRGARVLRFRGGTLLPGFIDLHVHSVWPSMLRTGVTTARNLGEPEAVLRPPSARRGYPRMFSSGPLITVPGGYPTRANPGMAAPVRSADEATAKVNALVAKGASVIKISLETFDGTVPTLDVSEVRAVVAAAHRHRRLVTAHVTDGRGVQIALDGGVDELAHMPCTGVSAEQLVTLAARDVAVVGTLRAGRVFRPQCRDSLTNARGFVAAGGRLLYGTDIPAVPAALDLVELGLMRQAGLTAPKALAAATAEAGRELGRARYGTLTPGAPADLWVVDGDPTQSFRALTRTRLVLARGTRIKLG